MGSRTYSVVNAVDTPLVTVAETVIATLAGVTTDRPGQSIRFAGECQITTGTNTTGLTFRIRRDTVAGVLLGEANVVQVEAVAGSTEDHDAYAEDNISGEIASATYVLTVQQAAASANGSCLRASLVADLV